MQEIITDSEVCWIFMYENNTLITYPFEVLGIGQKVFYPDNLTAVCEPTEVDANKKIKELNLIDPRNDETI